MKNQINEIFSDAAACMQQMAQDAALRQNIAQVVELITASLRKGGKVIVFGDGGSAADSQHLACELVGRFKMDRPALPAIALTTNTSSLTAIANDYGFEYTFARQVAALAKAGDVAIGISTSGKSPNVVKAIEEARRLNVATVGLTGGEGGQLRKSCDHVLCVAASATPRIQECHIIILHCIAELVERSLKT